MIKTAGKILASLYVHRFVVTIEFDVSPDCIQPDKYGQVPVPGAGFGTAVCGKRPVSRHFLPVNFRLVTGAK